MNRLAVLISTTLLLLASALHAEDTLPTPATDDTAAQRAEADRLHEEAGAVRQTAEAEHAAAQKTCWKRFLVSKCLDDASLSLRKEKARAAGLDSRARAIERDLKRREIAEKDAKRAAEDAARNTRSKP